MKITLPTAPMKAIASFVAPKDDTRTFLQGVHLEVERNSVTLVATDGNVLGAYRLPYALPDEYQPAHFTLPADWLKTVKKCHTIDLDIGDETPDKTRQVTVSYQGMAVTVQTYDIKFPQWRRVVPKTLNGKTQQFDINKLQAFAHAYDALAERKTRNKCDIVITHTSEGASLVSTSEYPDFMGLIMPIRQPVDKDGKPVAYTVPDWAKLSEGEK